MTTPSGPIESTSGTSAQGGRPIALVTGAGRTAGIGAAIATRLASDGWDVATAGWVPYDERMPWGSRDDDAAAIDRAVRAAGARSVTLSADLSDLSDLSDPSGPARLFDDSVTCRTGPARGRWTGSSSPLPESSRICGSPRT